MQNIMWCRRRQNPNESEHLEPLHHISTIATYNLRFRSVDRVNNTWIGENECFPQQLLEPLPGHPAWRVRPPIKPFVPESDRGRAHLFKTPPIAGYPVIGVVSFQFAHQGLKLLKRSIVSVFATPDIHCFERSSQALGRGPSLDHPVSFL